MFLVTGSSCNIETMKGGRSFYWTNVTSCIDVVYVQKRQKVRFAKIFGILRTFLLPRKTLFKTIDNGVAEGWIEFSPRIAETIF